MKEHPILFRAPMVRAILAGTKTQTRRIVKGEVLSASDGGKRRVFNPNDRSDLDALNGMLRQPRERYPLRRIAAPWCVGRRLWVRETWAAAHNTDHLKPSEIDCESRIHYAATENLGGLLKRPSIFIPRWASRIALEVTGVRVERLQEISRNDAIAEGITKPAGSQFWHSDFATQLPGETPEHAYRNLWESINGPGSWAANPWVWCIEFRRLA